MNRMSREAIPWIRYSIFRNSNRIPKAGELRSGSMQLALRGWCHADRKTAAGIRNFEEPAHRFVLRALRRSLRFIPAYRSISSMSFSMVP